MTQFQGKNCPFMPNRCGNPLHEPTNGQTHAGTPHASLLDTQELSFDLSEKGLASETDRASIGVSFRHSFWAKDRERVALCLAQAVYAPSRLTRFWQCGCRAWVQRSVEATPRYRVISARCNDRWCEACARERRWRVARNLVTKAPPGRQRFVTLTLRSNHASVGDSARRLIKCFRRLRQRPKLAPCFKGGAWFLEFTLNQATDRIHPHMHILTTGEYVPLEILRREWHRITGDSFVVDVREVKDLGVSAGYVVKYASKLLSRELRNNTELLVQAMRSIGKTKGWSVFGDWLKLKLQSSDTSETIWEYLEPLAEIWQRARHGDEDARTILAKLNRLQAILDAPASQEHDLVGPSP